MWSHLVAAALLVQCVTPVRSANLTCSGACNCNLYPVEEGVWSGTITDGSGSYHPNAHCEWVISSGSRIEFALTALDTEVGVDFLTISGCETSDCRKLHRIAQLSGTSFSAADTFTSWTGHAKVVFASDHSTSGTGFVLKWWALPPICGNGIQEGLEECEDGNTVSFSLVSLAARSVDCSEMPTVCD